MTQEQARAIALDWIEAWNSHDLNRIMEHYAEDVEFTTPFAVELLGDPAGTLRGKEQLRAYFARALTAFPELNFEFYCALASVNSLVVYYRSVRDLLAAEMMVLDDKGRAMRCVAHYTTEPGA
jgi:ketosteroid isomerase-like protein